MKKALIIQNKFIGDVLASSVIATNLKKIYPTIKVHFFCYNPAVAVLENNPNIDKIISFDDKKLKNISILNQFAKIIKNENYDLLIDPYAKLQSRYITLTSQATTRISFDKPIFKNVYTHTVKELNEPSNKTKCLALDERLSLLNPLLEGKNNIVVDVNPKIYLTQEEIEKGKKILESANIDFNRKTVMIGILGSSLDKSWPIEYMSKLVNHIQKHYNLNILFNYIPSQLPIVEDILSQLENIDKVYTQVLGKSVREFLTILYHCDAFLGNEGGGVNMAKALNKATFSIYSPHKFPKDWGCFEDGLKHSSVHLQSLERHLYNKHSVKEILKKAPFFYKKIRYDYVQEKVDCFLQQNFGTETVITLPKINKPKISALLITLNEEKNIQQFLDEANYANEIIIIDSESTDNTKKIAESHPKVKFITKKFNNFTEQKNFAIEQANNEWVTFFDADERISPALINELIENIKKNSADAFYVYRKFYFMDKHIKRSGWQNDKAIRVFKKSIAKYNDKRMVHEVLEIKGTTSFLKNKLDHYSYSSIEEYDRKLTQYAILRAKELFTKKLKPTPFHFWVKPWFRFVHHFILRLGILDGKEGYIISKIHARSVFKRYLFLSKMYENSAKK